MPAAYYRAKWAEYYKRNPKRFIESSRRAVQKYRTIVLNLLGNKCVRCAFYDLRAIQIDHVNAGGKAQMDKLGNSQKYYKHIIEQISLGSGEYQLLCANCNQIKRVENKESKNRRKPVKTIKQPDLFQELTLP